MHDAGIFAGAVFLRQNARNVVIGVAGVDDQGQARPPRGLDMNAQAVLLRLRAFGGVVVIQPRLADGHEFRVIGQGHQLIDGDHRFVRDAHRVGAGGVEDAVMGLGQGAHGGFLAQAGADGDHPPDACGTGTIDQGCVFAVEIGKIQVAMAVGQPEGRIGHRSGLGQGRLRGRQLRQFQHHIHDQRGRVKVDRPSRAGARRQAGLRLGPDAGGVVVG